MRSVHGVCYVFCECSSSSKRPPPLANINVHAHVQARAHTHIRSSELPVHQHVPVFHKCHEKKTQADHHSNTLYVMEVGCRGEVEVVVMVMCVCVSVFVCVSEKSNGHYRKGAAVQMDGHRVAAASYAARRQHH